MLERPVIVIGAGMGGLTAALLLACRGERVIVLERAQGPGGKLRPAALDGAAIDAGPTVFTMRWVFDDIFAAAGVQLDDVLTLRPLSILARHAWDDKAGLDLHADVNRSADAIAQFSNLKEAERYRLFMAEARQTFATLKDSFLTAPRGGLIDLMKRARISDLWRLNPFETLWKALERHFHDPRLRQLFGRYATYCGASPFTAPATLILIAHVEQDGVWSIGGGMSALAKALDSAAQNKGVEIHYGKDAQRLVVKGGKVTGVQLADGSILEADAVVFNGDVAALASGLLGGEARRISAKPDPGSRSLSAVTWAIKGRAEGRPLTRHNVFFSGDYQREFDDILGRRQLAKDPTVYVCAQDRSGGNDETAGLERFLCLINAPADGDHAPLNASQTEDATAAMLRRLARCGVDLVFDSSSCLISTPADFNRSYPATGGALYGRALHGWMTTFQREGSRTPIDGLFLAGGSVHPGPGVPMAALSGKLAAEAVLARRNSMRPFRKMATAGGMSTP